MKSIFTILLFVVTSFSFASSNTVKGAGMTGYFVYEDGGGNKILKHPTVPSVAYDLNGKKVDVSDFTAYRKIATVKSDGSFVPVGGSDSGTFGIVSGIFLAAIAFGIIYLAWKVKKKWRLHQEEQNALNRFKLDLDSVAHTLFWNFQKNMRPSQVDYIRDKSTESFFMSLQERIQNASDFAEVKAKNIQCSTPTVSKENATIVATVPFTYTLVEDDDGKERVISGNELWTFHMVNNKWLVAGIKDLAPKVISDWNEKTVVKEPELRNEKEMSATSKYSL